MGTGTSNMGIHEVKLGQGEHETENQNTRQDTGLTVLPPSRKGGGHSGGPSRQTRGDLQDGSGDSGAMAGQGAQEAMAGSLHGRALIFRPGLYGRILLYNNWAEIGSIHRNRSPFWARLGI